MYSQVFNKIRELPEDTFVPVFKVDTTNSIKGLDTLS